MALPKQFIKKLPLVPEKVGKERRQELLDEITDKGTFLPKGVLHADLDRGMLDFVKNQLELSVDEKKVPTIDRIITNQSWIQFTETWDFKDLDSKKTGQFKMDYSDKTEIYHTYNWFGSGAICTVQWTS